MSVPRLGAIGVSVALGTSMAIGACSRAAKSDAPPPAAEFLLSSSDSTFWIATTSGQVRFRGAPLTVARYDNRFYELYTADDDRSYSEALLVGERLYRRDLLTGDSAIVFTDTTVSHVANIYARTHPDENPLGPDQETDPDPATSATAEFDILDVFGPFLSYEYHVDIRLPHRTPWHSTRRGVIDLRSGKQAGVTDIVGRERAARLVADARHTFETLRDSAIRERKALSLGEQRALSTLERHAFDPTSFGIENVGGKPAVTFAIPGAGEGPAGNIVELDPITVDSLDWWVSIQPALPADSGDADRWTAPSYGLVARYDTSGQIARLFLTGRGAHEWSLGTATGPLHRVEWLDRPPVTSAERAALKRAFDAAANYDENARVAKGPTGHPDRIPWGHRQLGPWGHPERSEGSFSDLGHPERSEGSLSHLGHPERSEGSLFPRGSHLRHARLDQSSKRRARLFSLAHLARPRPH